MVVALVPAVAGAQAAQACTEPVFQKTFPYATAKQLVPINLTGVTPGTEYLLKVNGREVKDGIAEGETVSRKFRMPNLGDKRREARLVVVLANDACENSPWKVKQEMGYRPAPPTVTPPTSQQQQSQAQQQQQAQVQQQQTPAPAAGVTAPTPKPSTATKPVIPKPTIKREPPDDAKAWITPLDPYSKSSEPAPQASEAALPVSERSTDKANSTAALVGLGGVFILIGGISAIAWTRFRRYDDEQLAELLNPDGKLPSMLDDSAADMSGKEMMGASGVAAGSTEMVMSADGPVLKKAVEGQQGAEAPTVKAPVVSSASSIKAPLVPPVRNGTPVPNGAAPTNGSHASNGAAAPNGTNGTHVPNGTHAANGANGANGAGSYRQEVEAELQRILKEAGLDTELEGILSDARAEAERQGVPMDSELMLRALTEEGNGSGKLSDSAKGELKQRFQRIAAEEQGQVGPTPDQ